MTPLGGHITLYSNHHGSGVTVTLQAIRNIRRQCQRIHDRGLAKLSAVPALDTELLIRKDSRECGFEARTLA